MSYKNEIYTYLFIYYKFFNMCDQLYQIWEWYGWHVDTTFNAGKRMMHSVIQM